MKDGTMNLSHLLGNAVFETTTGELCISSEFPATTPEDQNF
jgi:hypothetical protein